MKLDVSPYLQELEARDIVYLRRSPQYVYVLCPFHADKNPSLSISVRSGRFQCWGCHETGSFYRLLAAWDGRTEEEERATGLSVSAGMLAYQELERLCEEQTPEARYYSLKDFCNVFPDVRDYAAALAYLDGRGIAESTATAFGLRWGIAGKYRDRIVIPILDPDCHLVSYAARSIHKDAIPKTRKPRRAQDTLFGLQRLLKDSPHWTRLVVVEGEPDSMYLQQWGVPAVAAMGTSGLTDAQIGLLVQYADEVVLAYDGDKAGQEAMTGRYKLDKITGRKRLTYAGDAAKIRVYMPVHIIRLPTGKDPNELSEREVGQIFGHLT